jgi:hypothetical protein
LRLSFALLVPALLITSGPALAKPPAPVAELVQLKDARADAVIVGELAEPGVVQTPLHDDSGVVDPFVRHQWRVKVAAIVRGKASELQPGAIVLVDDHAWRADYAEFRRCKGRIDCRWPAKSSLDTTLSRPPRPGQRLLFLLNATPDGWQLALDKGVDEAARVRQLARKRGAK